MATMNPFDLLGDDDAEDPSLLVAAQQQKLAAAPKKAVSAQPNKPGLDTKTAKLPSKPAPPSQAVRESKNDAGRGGRGGGRGFGYGRGRNGGGYNCDSNNENNSGYNRESVPAGQGAFEDAPKRRFSGGDGDGRPSERRGYGGDGDGRTTERRSYGGPRGSYHGGRRGGFGNGEVGDEERPRRTYERRSGTGRGNELKREGSGRGNWGSQTDEFPEVTEGVNATEKNLSEEKPVGEVDATDVSKEAPTNEPEEKEPEEKEMTLEEYEKVLEEKRKALQALKTEERKVDTREFESLQQLSNKKGNDDIFIKLGSEKDKKKESAEKEEKVKKSVSINEFLKPAEGERFSYPSRGGRGRVGRGPKGGGSSSNYSQSSSQSSLKAPPIEDPSHFPTLGGK